MTRFTGLMAIFLIFPLLIASHMPEDTDPEQKDTKEETFCPSATVQIHTGSGYVSRSSNTGVVGACTRWSVAYKSPVGGPAPTHFSIYEVRHDGTATEISRATCIYRSCSGGPESGTVAPSSRILVVGTRYSGGIGGGVAELDTADW